METSTVEDVEAHNREITWKLEDDGPEGKGDCQEVDVSDDEHDVDEPDSDAEVSYQSGYIQNDQDGDEPPPDKRPRYTYEPDPRTRKRQCKKLLQRLKLILDEFSSRVGQQAAIIVAHPPNAHVRQIQTYGSTPLQEVVRNYHPTILSCLSETLSQREPIKEIDPNRFELPPLIMDGTPIPVDKMTQAQLREFIPMMIRYSTGRGKPGWGLERTRPPWWPTDVPWQNIRLDPRDIESKSNESWSDTLRRIIIACYKYHDREDLLKEANGSYEEPPRLSRSHIDPHEDSSDSSTSHQILLVKPEPTAKTSNSEVVDPGHQAVYGQVVNNDGSISLYVPKESTGATETRSVILTDSDGREYCVQIAVPAGQASVLGNFQVAEPEQIQAVIGGQVVGMSN